MSDPRDGIVDAQLEAALARRAPHGPDTRLLADIARSLEATDQVPSWSLLPGASLVPTGRLVWLVALLALLAALAAGALSGAFRPDPNPLRDAIVPAPSTTASPRPESTSKDLTPGSGPNECTQTLTNVSVELNPPIEPSVDDAGLVEGRMAIVGAGTNVLWSIDAGGSLRVLARIHADLPVGWDQGFGPDIHQRLGPDPGILVRFVWSSSDFATTCADLFEIAWDGSSATRLTSEGDAVIPWLVQSSDGRRIAFQGHDGVRIVTPDGRGRLVEGSCLADERGTHAAFSPDGLRLAVICPDTMLVNDAVSGRSFRPHAFDQPTGNIDGVAWSPAGDAVRFVESWPALDTSSVRSVDVATGETTQLVRFLEDESLVADFPRISGFRGFVPDGTSLVYYDVALSRTRLLDLESGAIRDIGDVSPNGSGWFLTPPWTTDGSAFIGIRHGEDLAHELLRVDLEDGTTRTIGRGPADFEFLVVELP